MPEELFPVEESLSPYLLFLKQHGIQTKQVKDTTVWEAFVKQANKKEVARRADTEKKAVLALAQHLDLPGWQQLNWD